MSSDRHYKSAPPSRQPLLLRSQAAAILGLTVSALGKWTEKGTGPKFYRLGYSAHSRTAYRIEDVEDFVRERYGPEGVATLGTG
jgi:hypothetical protein